MSDEFNFDFVETPAEPVTEPAQAPDPAPPPSIDPQEYEAIKQKLSAFEQKQQALARFMAGETPQPQNDPNALVAEFAKDPMGFIDRIAAQRVQTQLAATQLEQEMTQKYSHLVPFKQEVINHAAMLQQQSMQTGKFMDDRAAIEQAAKDYETRLQGFLSTAQQRASAEAMKANALPFQVGQTGQQVQAGPINYDALSDADFGKLLAQRQRAGR